MRITCARCGGPLFVPSAESIELLRPCGCAASAIDARRAETPQSGSVHESAVPKADAPERSS